MTSDPRAPRRDRLWIVAIVFFAVMFWNLRVYYWTTTVELPFSDMSDYVVVAQQIRSALFFGANEALFAYYNPVTPSLLAISMLLGGESYLWVFRVLIQLITFSATLLLAYELALLTGRRWLGIAFLGIVAFCRPSIFWSLKAATEGPTEAFLLLAMGLSLRAFRTRSLWTALGCGLACILLALNRSQFLPSVLVVGLAFLLVALFERREADPGVESRGRARWSTVLPRVTMRLDKRRLAQAACFALGLAVIWAPWIARNYSHYHAFIPTGTSGMDTIIFDLAGAPIRAGRYTALRIDENITVTEFDFRKVREVLGPGNDYEIAQRERKFFLAWLDQNWRDFPRLVVFRLKHLIAEYGAFGLTQVSRDVLFPADVARWNTPYTRKSWTDLVLLDKAPWVILLGFAGMGLVAIRHGMAGLTLGILSGLSWLAVALATGFERTVEPLTSAMLWFATYFLSEAFISLSRRDTVNMPMRSP